MDGTTLARAMGNSLSTSRYVELAPPFTTAMRAAECTTVERAAMWCAQLGHESAGLRYLSELADGSAYEGRRDLGNCQAGDGPRFKGAGPLQLTGRANFREFSRWCFDHEFVSAATSFEERPELVRTDPTWGLLAATWYWTVARPQINALCDDDDLDGVTRAINGGLNGLADRRRRWKKCLRMGERLLLS